MEDIAEAELIWSVEEVFRLILLVCFVLVHSLHCQKNYLSKSACATFPV